MNNSGVIILIFAVVVLYSCGVTADSGGTPRCGPLCRTDQVCNTCGTACPPTCQNPKPSSCTKQCVLGCQCMPGLYTQPDGSCIEPSKCSDKCRSDQVYNRCGTACPPTCENPKLSICILECVAGCHCKPGLYTQPDGSCIEPSKCPKKCD